ncbi:LysR family transcriptional regulator, regulator for metE and metH [Aquimarina amphilecti]|uniref:LysR family transcriptional regulator, regulator for metE and metH n=1 Tax=Aquimarina amphilecti TaxID=1038014 RepID=A0A1H7HBY0_AQUAM|nr:LysR family transcriptional regulator [Aquimarina amphilecti]SEK47759.1 LysR family transcriptional regulator, regulator for metE and metH [Aquimarina amphilecti]
MELKYFRLIKTIAEEGSIANSTERLFLTQSALSHQLRELEERLGFKVFYRTRNKWELTQEGSELYKLANKLFSSIDEGFTAIRHIKEGAKGTIKLSAECQSFFHSIPAFIQKMGILYPEIDIDISLGATHQTISQVLSDDIDIAIVTTRPNSDELSSIPVFRDEIFAIMHQEHPLNNLAYLDASHFANVHLLINSFPIEGVAVYEHFLRPNKINPIKISAIPFTEITLSMIQANMGIMCAPKWQLNSFKLSKDLVFRRIGKNGLKRKHYLVVKKKHRNRKYIHDFISNFEEDFLEA